MRIIWHGHSCFSVKDGVVVVTDPHDGKSIGIKQPVVKADIVLVSHDHFDHNCIRIVKGDFTTIKEPGERTEKGIKILGVQAFHDAEQGGKRGKDVIFKFEVDGVRFCHFGDLGHLLSKDQIEKIGEVDVLFIPVGGVFTINAAEAHRLIDMIRPKIAVPMHYRVGGLSLSIQTLDEFERMARPEKVNKVGNEVEFQPEDLPKSTEYWIFSL
ncbi:MAG: MBL fold metallo-hydrolase [Methanomassiliicoccales archaeon]|nr:MAG: MBL fold metallo-hydrolase [Methanomassiliicoccales archaeon]